MVFYTLDTIALMIPEETYTSSGMIAVRSIGRTDDMKFRFLLDLVDMSLIGIVCCAERSIVAEVARQH